MEWQGPEPFTLSIANPPPAAIALSPYTLVTPRNGEYSAAMERMKLEFEREFLAIGPGPRSPSAGAKPGR